MSRATSQAAVTSVKDCLALLKLQLQDNQSLYDASPQHNISNDLTTRSQHLGSLDSGGGGGIGGEKDDEEKQEIELLQ